MQTIEGKTRTDDATKCILRYDTTRTYVLDELYAAAAAAAVVTA